jgi:putative nucleotidyltransferase with HDIG domain
MPNPTRAEALFLMESWTASDSLRKHMLAVEAAVRAYAVRFGEDEERWGITGLLHDFDYERFPNAEQAADAEHPAEGVRYLQSLGVDDDVCQAILGHAHYTGVPRTSRLAKTLFACDELTGLLTACALVKPSRSLADVEVPGVRKKLKDKAFARGVSRDDIVSGAAELGIALDEHIAFVLSAMQEQAAALGLDGRLAVTSAGPHDSTPLTGGA